MTLKLIYKTFLIDYRIIGKLPVSPTWASGNNNVVTRLYIEFVESLKCESFILKIIQGIQIWVGVWQVWSPDINMRNGKQWGCCCNVKKLKHCCSYNIINVNNDLFSWLCKPSIKWWKLLLFCLNENPIIHKVLPIKPKRATVTRRIPSTTQPNSFWSLKNYEDFK